MNTPTEYWMEDLETMPRQALAGMQLEKLKGVLGYCLSSSEFYRRKYGEAGVSAGTVRALADIQALPFTTRDEIVSDQEKNGRLGTLVCNKAEEPGQTIGMTGIKFSASGKPIRVLLSVEDAASQGRLAARGLVGAGVESRDYLYVMDFPQFNPLYMHLGLGSINVGAKSILAGMERAERNTSIYTRLYPPNCFYISPTYSKLVTSLLKATGKKYSIHTVLGWSEAGYSLPLSKQRFQEMWGELSDQPVDVCDVYGMVEVGLLGFECRHHKGIHGFEDAYLYEIIDPDSGRVLEPGEEGELVVTHLERTGMPLVRYRTGDITSILTDPCTCGRTHLRLAGIKGRRDQALRVGGKILYQSQIEEALAEHTNALTAFNVVTGSGEMSALEMSLVKDGTGGRTESDLGHACSRSLGVPVSIRYKSGDEVLTFIHRSQKVFTPENRDRLMREARNQRRAET
jgi:phenylacetate-CoA ligase